MLVSRAQPSQETGEVQESKIDHTPGFRVESTLWPCGDMGKGRFGSGGRGLATGRVYLRAFLVSHGMSGEVRVINSALAGWHGVTRL